MREGDCTREQAVFGGAAAAEACVQAVAYADSVSVTAPPPPQQQQPPSQQQATTALVVILASGIIPTAVALTPIAVALGVTVEALELAIKAAGSITGLPRTAQTPERIALAENVRRRASMVVNLARRAQDGVPGDMLASQARQHLQASRARQGAAQAVSAAMSRYGLVLGWQAIMDLRTTAGCREASGNNFSALAPPVVEGEPAYPGWPHGATCRCIAVRPFPGGRRLS